MTRDRQPLPSPASTPVLDLFPEMVGRGRVVGSEVDPTHRRLGVDREKTLSIDRSGLRISPLERPGWGRSSLAYGPFAVRPGLVVVAHVLNGHQASQTYTLRRLGPRLQQWLQGSGTRRGWGRALRLLRDRRRTSSQRRIRSWVRMTRATDSPLARRLPPLARRRERLGREGTVLDNLVVGLLAYPSAADLDDIGSGFVIRSADRLSGELRVTTGPSTTAVVDRLGALPLHLAVVCRADSALYAVSSLADSRGMPGHPYFRPLAVGPLPAAPSAYLAVQQNVSGEIGFSVDTRIFGLAAAEVAGCAPWWAGAHVADLFSGSGPVTDTSPAAGPAWAVTAGQLDRGPSGLEAAEGAIMLADPRAPTGLVDLQTSGFPLAVALLWRAADAACHWRLELRGRTFRLGVRTDGHDRWLDEGELPLGVRSIQVLDDGYRVQVLADGAVASAITVGPEPEAGLPTGVGLEALVEGHLGIIRLEAHPSLMELPTDVQLDPAQDLRGPVDVVIDDDFAAPADTPLEGRVAYGADQPVWQRCLGTGRLVIDRPGRVVIESCRDRTALTLPWTSGGLADLTARIVPRRRSGAQCRAGLIALQDADNYLCINLWFNDRDDGAASVSSFLTVDGHEDVYDAIWVNVWDRLVWDRAVDLQLIFDGQLYQVMLDGEPILWRRLVDVYPQAPPLRIEQVGLLANWEWGFDTGSHIERFTARRRQPLP